MRRFFRDAPAEKEAFGRMSDTPLRTGFTTGTCAAAAAKAAALWMFEGKELRQVEILTPKGTAACLTAEKRTEDGRVWFAVQKDAGDDPDVTNGTWVWASVEPCAPEECPDASGEPPWFWSDEYPGLYLTGGKGIGRVTKPGLACPVGSYAINPVPRAMIFRAVGEVWERQPELCGCRIRIQIPEGEALAERTFNPRLGIVGGISVLGTSGIVEPMSEQALLDTVALEIHMRAAQGCKGLILTPGNYGEQFIRDTLGMSLEQAVKCSNFAADAIERAAGEGFRWILFVGHIGKLIKVAGGVRNTHSKYGDRRMEILAECLETAWKKEQSERQIGKGSGRGTEAPAPGRPEADENGSADRRLLRERILSSNTTEEALDHLKAAGLLEPVMEEVTARIAEQMNEWAGGKAKVDVIVFSSVHGLLGQSPGAGAWRKGKSG